MQSWSCKQFTNIVWLILHQIMRVIMSCKYQYHMFSVPGHHWMLSLLHPLPAETVSSALTAWCAVSGCWSGGPRCWRWWSRWPRSCCRCWCCAWCRSHQLRWCSHDHCSDDDDDDDDEVLDDSHGSSGSCSSSSWTSPCDSFKYAGVIILDSLESDEIFLHFLHYNCSQSDNLIVTSTTFITNHFYSDIPDHCHWLFKSKCGK